MKASRIITGLLALLGFTGCHIEIGGGRVEYGTPHATFEVKGRVTDSDGDPVRDIKVVVGDPRGGDGFEYGVGITDASGRYEVTGGWFGGSDLSVVAEDIDGDKNGGDFETESRVLRIDGDDYVGGRGWFRGKVTKKADFELESKSQENEDE